MALNVSRAMAHVSFHSPSLRSADVPVADVTRVADIEQYGPDAHTREKMMNEERKPEDRRARKPYERPEITQVSLRPEEAVLGACKAGKVSGPGQPRCAVPAPCSSVGS